MAEVLGHVRWPASNVRRPEAPSPDALLETLAQHFPATIGARPPTPDDFTAKWQMTLASLCGKRHPILNAVDALRAPRDAQHLAAAVADATWISLIAQCLNRRLASWAACGWSPGAVKSLRDALNDAKRAEAVLFEAEAIEYVQGRLGRALPPATDRPAPEAIFFTSAGTVGLEAKCTAPMNDAEAAELLERARTGHECLQVLAAADRQAWLVFDKACSRDVALDDARRVASWQPPIAARQLPLGEPQGAGGLSTVREEIPADALTLEGWWADDSANDPNILWSASLNEAKVTLAHSWPAIENRVRKNLIEADGQHGEAEFGVTFVRVRPPPFGLDVDLLPRLAREVVPRVASRLRRTTMVCLTALRGSLPPAATTRQRYGPGAGLELTPSTPPDTHVEMLFIRIGSMPDRLADALVQAGPLGSAFRTS